MSWIFTGVDIGINGAIVTIDINQKIIRRSTIPKIGGKVDNKALVAEFELFAEKHNVIGLEDVHSIFGASAKANFTFGEIKGKKIGIAETLAFLYGHRIVYVPPKVWQKRIWSNVDMVYKPKKPKDKRKKVDTKKTSLMAAKRLFPNEDFLRNSRCTVPHDGLVDAALIAQYVYLEYR